MPVWLGTQQKTMSFLAIFKKTHFRITIPISACSSFMWCKAWRHESESVKTMYLDAVEILICPNFSSESLTDYLSCCVGVRQGKHLSPLLFNLFLNDTEDSFRTKDCRGIAIDFMFSDSLIHVQMAIVLVVLLYANDTILIAEHYNDIQVQESTSSPIEVGSRRRVLGCYGIWNVPWD